MADQRPDADELRIRARIDERRSRMGATIEEVGSHLNPDHLKQEFRAGVRDQVEQTKRELRSATIGRAENLINEMEDSVNRTRRTLIETIRDNPVPAAMAGIGLGWMIADARRHNDHDGHAFDYRFSGRDHDSSRREYARFGGGHEWYGRDYDRFGTPGMERDRYGTTGGSMNADAGATSQARERVADVADQARSTAERVQETVSDSVDRTRQRASELTDRAEEAWHDAEERARRARAEVRHLSEDNPLAAGAVALALGFAAGMMVPETSRERQLMGSARDRVVDRIQEAASDTMEKVGRVAEATAEAARETAGQEASRQGLMGDDRSTERDFPTPS